MGWDCSLHVVDETVFARFTARFLHGDRGDGAFDAAFPDADDLIVKTKKLANGASGGRAVGELLLLYVSTDTPHRYCRGFALSLWDDEAMKAPLSLHGYQTLIETKLPEVMAQYPKLDIPSVFDQNYCVGPYVPAEKVPALLSHVEGVLAKLDPGDRDSYEPLVEVLRVAAAKHMAYWEGTDLGVKSVKADWFAVEPPSGLTIVKNSITKIGAQPKAIAGTRMIVPETFVLDDVDISVFPPKVTRIEGLQCIAAAFTPWGTTLARIATDRSKTPYEFAMYDGYPTKRDIDGDIKTLTPVEDAVIGLPLWVNDWRPGCDPIVIYQDRVERIAMPEVKELACSATAFGDGSLLLVWGRVAYHWSGSGPPRELGALGPCEGPSSSYLDDDGAIIGAFSRTMHRVTRAGAIDKLLPFDNVMGVARGPEGSVIMWEGKNKQADVFKIWWRDTKQLTHVSRTVAGTKDVNHAYYDAARQQLVIMTIGQWIAIPWATLAELPRKKQK